MTTATASRPTTNDVGIVLLPHDKIPLLEGFIVSGLAKICLYTGEDFGIEDLTLSDSKLFILFSREGNYPLGFFTATLIEGSLDISAVYASKSVGAPLHPFALQKAIEYAIIVKATAIQFSSPRKGVAKLARSLGFNLYKKEGRLNYFSRGINHGSEGAD